MTKYVFTATVYRTVTDTMSIVVEATDAAEAHQKASQMLGCYPQPHPIEGVPFCFVENRDTGEPHLLDLTIIKELSDGS